MTLNWMMLYVRLRRKGLLSLDRTTVKCVRRLRAQGTPWAFRLEGVPGWPRISGGLIKQPMRLSV